MGAFFGCTWLALSLFVFFQRDVRRIACALERLAKAAEDERGEHVDAAKGKP